MAIVDTVRRVVSRSGDASGAPVPLPPPGMPAASVPPASEADAMAASEMSFLDHLEDLRWHLFKGLGAMLLCIVLSAFFAGWIVDHVLLAPSRPDFWTYEALGVTVKPFELQNRTVSGQFWVYIGSVLAVGAIAGFPFLLFQLWKFIEPGLYPKERRELRGAAWGASLFFLVGVAFGYFFLTPLSLQFFANFEISERISNQFDIDRYFSMITMWSLGTGVLFELPVVIYYLSKLGVVTSEMLRKGRRIAVVVILIIAAFITPPDPFSQVLVSMPLFLLYELAIVLAVRNERKRAKQEALDEAAAQAETEHAPVEPSPAEAVPTLPPPS